MLNVTTETTVTIRTDKQYADKLSRAIGRLLESQARLPADVRTWLVNTGTVDTVLALKTAIYMATEED